MPLSERFGTGLGTTLGVQLRAIANISTIEVTGVIVQQTDIMPRRVARILFVIDGEGYQLDLHFEDETLDARDLLGKLKKKVNE